jgi:flagellar protein FliO/FliZ
MMDFTLYLRFALALLFVLGLIGAVAWILRRFGVAGRLGPVRGRDRRLQVIEATPLDARNRLVLLRRDQVEHLVIVGPAGHLLVESGIAAPAASAAFGAHLSEAGEKP